MSIRPHPLFAFLLYGFISTASALDTSLPEPKQSVDDIQMAYEHRAYEPAFHMLSKLKQRTPAQDFMLGDLYAKGLGVVKQPHKGLKFTMRAAQAGEPRAQLALGELFMRGDGPIPKDYSEAALWLHKAAANNNANAKAQLQLGLMYQQGRGVEKLPLRAYSYVSAAAEQGNKTAIKMKGEVFSSLTEEQRKTLQSD